MRPEYFPNDKTTSYVGRGVLDTISNVINDNKALIHSAVDTGKSIYEAGKSIKEAANVGKTNKNIIEEMKTEKVYKDLLELDQLHQLKTGTGFKII